MSIIGSVGAVFGPFFNFSNLMEKIGVQSLTLTEGKDKDMINPFRPWKEGEDKSIKDILSYTYERFVDIMVTAHPRLNRDLLVQEYGAQVFIAPTAQSLGYIDVGDSSYENALADLVKAANISPEEKYQVIQLKYRKPFLAELTENRLQGLSGTVVHRFDFGSTLRPELSGRPLYLYQPLKD